MSILKVARLGHPVLRAVAQPVPTEAFGSSLFQKLIDDLQETMYEHDGVGLAAPQVHEGLRLAVLEIPASDERSPAEVPFLVLANPVVTPLGREIENAWEGCLSVPDLRGTVPRHTRIKLDALDRHGKRFTLEAEGFLARVIQHECDHLAGVVFLDRMLDMRSLSFIKEFEDHVASNEQERD